MARAGMVDDINVYAMLGRDSGEDALDEHVMRSLGTVERHQFVPTRQQRFAYENRPLPIGHGQTISQPYIVALMTDLIEPDRDFVVLEIGTGSGYQAAILAQLVMHVSPRHGRNQVGCAARRGWRRARPRRPSH